MDVFSERRQVGAGTEFLYLRIVESRSTVRSMPQTELGSVALTETTLSVCLWVCVAGGYGESGLWRIHPAWVERLRQEVRSQVQM